MERALPLLELSGIIAIRRHCMSIVSASQLRMATKYLLGDIPNLLSRLHLWVQSRAGSPDAEKSKRTRDALNAMEHRLRRVRISLGSASRCFQKLLTPLKQDLHTAPINNLRKRLIEKFDRGINDCKGHVTSTATAATCNLTNAFKDSDFRIATWEQGAIAAGQIWGTVSIPGGDTRRSELTSAAFHSGITVSQFPNKPRDLAAADTTGQEHTPLSVGKKGPIGPQP